MAKIRQGFVSNSSSSSFVLLKGGLDNETINEFRDWVEVHNSKACEGYLEETKSTFTGEKDQHVDIPPELCEKIRANIEYPDY